MTGGLKLPIGQNEQRRYRVGEIIATQPGIRRVSRRVAYRGYYINVVRAVDEEGRPTKVEALFQPRLKYDPSVLSTNKY